MLRLSGRFTRIIWTRMPQQQSIARFFSGGSVSPAKRQKTDPVKAEHASAVRKAETDASLVTGSNSPLADELEQKLKQEPKPDVQGDRKQEIKEELKIQHQIAASPAKTPAPSAKLGGTMAYSEITKVFEQVETTSSRLAITALVCNMFLKILRKNQDPEVLTKVVYLCINRLGPDYEADLELGLGETLLIKAISECYGRSSQQIKKDYQETGDLGLVAQRLRLGQPTMFKPQPLDVDTVFGNLTKIAKSTGKDSQLKKIGIINKMLTACDLKSSEAKFLIRSLEGKLRIGLAEKTVLLALCRAFLMYELPNREPTADKISQAEDVIKEAFLTIPNYQIIIDNSFKYGILSLLEHCQLTPGIPLKPMLAKPTKSISEVLDRFQGEEFTCEYKYDGERAQIHYFENEIRIYLRNSEDMSQRYPDLISVIRNAFKKVVDEESNVSCILDCEVVAWDKEQEKILPFQVLSTRKRKAVDEKDIKVNICLFIFDILYFNGTSLISKSLKERRVVMQENLILTKGSFQFANARNSADLDELQLFLDQSVKDSCEGLMVKMLNGKDSFYEPSKRLRSWLKLKKDYMEGVGDSLDLVVVGAYIGKGKRTGTYGGFLLAAYNQDSGEYETTCKIGTGFSEEMLAQLYEKLKPTEIPRPKGFYVYDSNNSNASPDVWFEPTTLFEVLTADLSLSPVYKAAHNEYTKGISLRFPRFLRIRDDKGIEDATSSDQISEMYQRQASVQ